MPGGARHENETALSAALREAGEKSSVPADALEVLFESVFADPESLDLQWIALDAVTALPLHPRFSEAWPTLRKRL